MAKYNKFITSTAGLRGGVYTCEDCGKQTRETGASESNVSLCVDCYENAGLENEHSDGGHSDKPHPSCKQCTATIEAAVRTDLKALFNKCEPRELIALNEFLRTGETETAKELIALLSRKYR